MYLGNEYARTLDGPLWVFDLEIYYESLTSMQHRFRYSWSRQG